MPERKILLDPDLIPAFREKVNQRALELGIEKNLWKIRELKPYKIRELLGKPIANWVDLDGVPRSNISIAHVLEDKVGGRLPGEGVFSEILNSEAPKATRTTLLEFVQVLFATKDPDDFRFGGSEHSLEDLLRGPSITNDAPSGIQFDDPERPPSNLELSSEQTLEGQRETGGHLPANASEVEPKIDVVRPPYSLHEVAGSPGGEIGRRDEMVETPSEFQPEFVNGASTKLEDVPGPAEPTQSRNSSEPASSAPEVRPRRWIPLTAAFAAATLFFFLWKSRSFQSRPTDPPTNQISGLNSLEQLASAHDPDDKPDAVIEDGNALLKKLSASPNEEGSLLRAMAYQRIGEAQTFKAHRLLDPSANAEAAKDFDLADAAAKKTDANVRRVLIHIDIAFLHLADPDRGKLGNEVNIAQGLLRHLTEPELLSDPWVVNLTRTSNYAPGEATRKYLESQVNTMLAIVDIINCASKHGSVDIAKDAVVKLQTAEAVYRRYSLRPPNYEINKELVHLLIDEMDAYENVALETKKPGSTKLLDYDPISAERSTIADATSIGAQMRGYGMPLPGAEEGTVLCNQANVFEQENKLKEANAYMRLAIAALPADESHAQQARWLVKLASIQVDQGQFEEALVTLRMGDTLRPVSGPFAKLYDDPRQEVWAGACGKLLAAQGKHVSGVTISRVTEAPQSEINAKLLALRAGGAEKLKVGYIVR